MMRRLFLIGFAAAGLSACATAERVDAANDVHALLVAIRNDDQAAFDAHVDRSALQAQLTREIETQGTKRYGDLARLLAPGLAQLAGDVALQPRVFERVAEQYGYGPDKPIPGVFGVAAALKPIGDSQVCVVKKKDGPCTLIFTKEAGAWKLTGYQGKVSDLRLKL
jgi:hypothetical protein